jgi:hypothetical protein
MLVKIYYVLDESGRASDRHQNHCLKSSHLYCWPYQSRRWPSRLKTMNGCQHRTQIAALIPAPHSEAMRSVVEADGA